MQLARAGAARRPSRATATRATPRCPEAVREAVLSETAPLPADARALLDGAAIVGDPFEIDFAAEVAGLERDAALVGAGRARGRGPRAGHRRACGASASAIRSCAAPSTRRSAPAGGWPGTRARPRASSARAPDRSRSPTTSSSPPRRATPPPSRCSPRRRRRSRAAPRRPPCTGSRSRARSCRGPIARVQEAPLLGPLAGALAGAGRFDDARRVLLELLAPLPDGFPGAHGADRRLRGDGPAARRPRRRPRAPARRPGGARRSGLAATRSRSAVELAAHASLRGDPLEMRDVRDRGARGRARAGRRRRSWRPRPPRWRWPRTRSATSTEARARGREAAVLVAALADEQLGARLEMLLFLGWSEYFLGEFALALEHFARGSAIARRAGSAVLALELMVGEALGLLARGRHRRGARRRRRAPSRTRGRWAAPSRSCGRCTRRPPCSRPAGIPPRRCGRARRRSR